MKLTYKFKLKEKNNSLKDLCLISKNLYNQANFMIRQEFILNKKYLNYSKIYSLCKNLEEFNNYKLLKAQVSQQILMLLDKNWKSFFESIKEWNRDKSKFLGKPSIPKYIRKNQNLLIYTNQSCRIKDNFIILSKDLKIKIPKYKGKDFTKFQQVRILPIRNYYEIEIIYNQDCLNLDLDTNNFASIDLGINNLISFISKEKCFLFSGKILKSSNQHFNKFYSKLKSIKDKKSYKSTINSTKIFSLQERRKNEVKDYFHKISKSLISYCIKNKIGNLVIGYNVNWKDSINLGKQNNQNFVQIPYRQLISYLKYKCELVGIKFIENEESYTSKCDSLALEPIEYHQNYLGKRIRRGLFQSSIGKLINADINGSLNILRKVLNDSHEFIQEIIDSRVLFNPITIRTSFDLLNFCKGNY